MKPWRKGVDREIPGFVDGELTSWIDEAWRAFHESSGGKQLRHHELNLVEGRLRRLECCRTPDYVHLLDAWRTLEPPPLTLCVLATTFEVWRPSSINFPNRQAVVEDQFAALFELPRSVGGSALIRPETLSDKVAELISRREVDFAESPRFSKRYYLPASDEEALRAALSKDLLDHFATRNDLHAELLDRDMLVFWPARPSKRSLLEALPFFVELARLIGGSGSPYR